MSSSKNVDNAELDRTVVGKNASIIGIICCIILSALKFSVGFVTQNLSTIADAIDNITDVLSSVITLISFRLIKKKATANHPYGFARIEYVSSLIISLLILVAGYECLKTAIESLFTKSAPEFSLLVIIVMSISVVVKFCLFLMYKILGAKINSNLLKAAGADALMDTVRSFIILLGAFTSLFTAFNIDAIIASLASIFIMYNGFKLALKAINPLLGASPDKKIVAKMVEIIKSDKDVLGYHDLIIHEYGIKNLYATCHIELDSENTLNHSHDVVDKLEKKIFTNLNVRLVCHIDPVETSSKKRQEALKFVSDYLAKIDETISVHDLRIDKNHIEFDLLMPYESKINEETLIDELKNEIFIKYENIDVNITVDRGENLI